MQQQLNGCRRNGLSIGAFNAILSRLQVTRQPPVISSFNPTDLATVEALVDFLESPQSSLESTETLSGVAAGTTLGQVREENQDRHLIAQYFHRDAQQSFFVAVIADGVGSLKESGLAASAAISAFVAALISEIEGRSANGTRSSWGQMLGAAIQRTNRYVYHRRAERGASTLSAVVVPADHPACAVHVGDSKIFGLSKDFGFTQLSTDQTVGTHLQALGLPLGKTVGRDPRFDRALAQYIGMAEDLQPQFLIIEKQWDQLLLATDGVVAAKRVLSEEGWGLISRHAKSRADFVRKILTFTNWNGGDDNSTIVLIPISKKLLPGPTNSGMSFLSAVSGSRTIEMHMRALVTQPGSERASGGYRKRQKADKFRRDQKVQGKEAPLTAPEGKAESKSVPSITFLPGLSKDDYGTKNPGSV